MEIPLTGETDDIVYKYVVDGEWKVNPDELTTKDESGNENNIIAKEQLHELTTIPGAFIPESGLVAATSTNPVPKEGELNTTVLPKEDPHHASVAGEPGVFVPKDKETLSAFETFEDTDAKALNENVTEIGTANTNGNEQSTIPAPATGVLVEGSQLTPEERKKQKKKIKRSQYKAKKKKNAAEAKGANGEATSGSSELDSEGLTPETTTKDVAGEENEKENITSTGFVAGGAAAASATAASAALASHSETLGSTTKTDDIVTKDVEEPIPVDVTPVDDGVNTTAAVVDVPVVEESTPVVADVTPVVEESTTVVEESIPVVNGSTPIVETEATDAPKTLDPKVALDTEAQEVDASPVHKEPVVVSHDKDDIIIATAGDSAKDLTAAVEAREGGNVTLEEIEPTASQRERLTKEANINSEAVKKAETPANKTATTPATTSKASGTTEEKKKGGFRRILKKIFS